MDVCDASSLGSMESTEISRLHFRDEGGVDTEEEPVRCVTVSHQFLAHATREKVNSRI